MTRILDAFVLLYGCLACCLVVLIALLAVALRWYARRRSGPDEDERYEQPEPDGEDTTS